MIHVLVVEDDKEDAEALALVLTELGYTTAKADSYMGAINEASKQRPDLVLMDVHLNGHIDGIDTAVDLIRLYDVPVVYLSGSIGLDALERMKDTEPYGCVAKPVKASDLYTTIEIAIHKNAAEKARRR